MPSLDYDPSRKALYQPELRETLLGPGLSEVQLALECARLAYYRFDEDGAEAERLTKALALAGFGAPTLFKHPGSDGEGFAAVDAAGRGLLAFRGTQPDRIGDLVTDARTNTAAWTLEGGRGKVHAGFRNTALGLWPEVQDWLGKTRPQRLIACGHSLGAAIATLLAVPARAQRLVTIGSPRVGNAEFVAHVAASGLENTRVVDCCDVVTEIPPALLGFEHLPGLFVYLDRDGGQHPEAAPALIDADRQAARRDYLGRYAFRLGTVLIRDLADHAPVNYLRAFWP
ncbi:lipase family protein [Pelomonas sp. KK5]|uniref:lipase family protein n=1 Tax=Pelomonas sp. KK5 TaxID=1855730 RepID=UPI0009FA7ED0|nr:lipase family protein [Pelomonas sp. KK5]